MTLIITELTFNGIIMSGDSACTFQSITPMGTFGDRAFFGLRKVIPVQKLQAGISFWGWAKMPPQADDAPWMDDWLDSFLQRNLSEYDSIQDLASLLEAELRDLVPPLREVELGEFQLGLGGVHLAGYTMSGNNQVPCFWHIHNGISQALPNKELDPHIVNANYDVPPERFLESRHVLIHNGEYEAFARFFYNYFQNYQRELRNEMGIAFPQFFLRDKFWRAQIKFIAALYSVGVDTSRILVTRLPRSIGGEVTTLTITPTGILEYETR